MTTWNFHYFDSDFCNSSPILVKIVRFIIDLYVHHQFVANSWSNCSSFIWFVVDLFVLAGSFTYSLIIADSSNFCNPTSMIWHRLVASRIRRFAAMSSANGGASSFAMSIPDLLHKYQVAHWKRIPLKHLETYLFWKSQIMNWFRIHHVTETVNGSTSPPLVKTTDDTANPEYNIWMEKNYIVLG